MSRRRYVLVPIDGFKLRYYLKKKGVLKTCERIGWSQVHVDKCLRNNEMPIELVYILTSCLGLDVEDVANLDLYRQRLESLYSKRLREI